MRGRIGKATNCEWECSSDAPASLPLFLKTIYEDKDREEEIITSSESNWLIVRPAGLTNGPRTGNYRVITDLEGTVAKRISRLDVADFFLRVQLAPVPKTADSARTAGIALRKVPVRRQVPVRIAARAATSHAGNKCE